MKEVLEEIITEIKKGIQKYLDSKKRLPQSFVAVTYVENKKARHTFITKLEDIKIEVNKSPDSEKREKSLPTMEMFSMDKNLGYETEEEQNERLEQAQREQETWEEIMRYIVDYKLTTVQLATLIYYKEAFPLFKDKNKCLTEGAKLMGVDRATFKENLYGKPIGKRGGAVKKILKTLKVEMPPLIKQDRTRNLLHVFPKLIPILMKELKMEVKLGTMEPERWQKMAQNNIPVDIGREDWIFAICGLYNKGQVELYLCNIANPKVSKEKLLPLTPKDWEQAQEKAREILVEKTGNSATVTPASTTRRGKQRSK